MEMSQLPKLSLAYTLSGITDERLRRYIELQALKLVAVELQDTRSLKILNRIVIKNPVYERFLKYGEAYRAFEKSRSQESADKVSAIAEDLRQIASTVADILQDIGIKSEVFADQIGTSKTAESQKLKLEFRFLKVALENLFRFTAPEAMIK